MRTKQSVRIGALGVLLVWSGVTATQAQVADWSDLHYWGSGANRSAFVVDWDDGKANETLAWGFRWDGTLTVYDMITSLVTGDPRFFARVDNDAGFGAFIFGLGYQNSATAFDVVGTVDDVGNAVSSDFVDGVWDINTQPGWEGPLAFDGAPLNVVDQYLEGFGWEFYLGEAVDENVNVPGTFFQAGPTTTYPGWWGFATLGASDTSLVNDGWYALSHAGGPPGPALAAIPEPSAAVLVLLGAGMLAWFRRRRA